MMDILIALGVNAAGTVIGGLIVSYIVTKPPYSSSRCAGVLRSVKL